jgi:hypothetical protein
LQDGGFRFLDFARNDRGDFARNDRRDFTRNDRRDFTRNDSLAGEETAVAGEDEDPVGHLQRVVKVMAGE